MHQNTAIHLNVIEKPPRIKGSLPLSRFDRNAPESALSEMFVVDHALSPIAYLLSPVSCRLFPITDAAPAPKPRTYRRYDLHLRWGNLSSVGKITLSQSYPRIWQADSIERAEFTS